MGFDLWRLFAGVDADHVQFLFLQKYQGRKKQRGGYFDYEFGIYFIFIFFDENNYVGNES